MIGNKRRKFDLQVSYNEFMDEGKGQFGCLANINTGPQVISREDKNYSSSFGES